MRYQLWRLAVVIFLVGIVVSVGTDTPAVLAQEETSQEPEQVFITNPDEGQTLSGMVTVTGTVHFPDFLKYELFLKSGDNLAWVATGYSPVVNGNLARLDTRLFLDGTYQLVIRQVNSDSNYTDYVGPTVTLMNGLGSPLNDPDIESSFLYPPATGSLLRVRNCSGHNIEFDYNSPQGFCSAQDLWIMFKPDDHDFCPSMDVQLIADCEYRGTAVGEGQPVGATYSFEAEEGKIYEFTYAGEGRFFLGEVAGDARAETDTGAEKIAAARSAAAQPASSDTLLPVSGRGQATNLYFIGVAFGLIVLLLIGGVIAVRQKGYLS